MTGFGTIEKTIEERLLPSDAEVRQQKLATRMIMGVSPFIAATGPAFFALAHGLDEAGPAFQAGLYVAGTLTLASGIGMFVTAYRANAALSAYENAVEVYCAERLDENPTTHPRV